MVNQPLATSYQTVTVPVLGGQGIEKKNDLLAQITILLETNIWDHITLTFKGSKLLNTGQLTLKTNISDH